MSGTQDSKYIRGFTKFGIKVYGVYEDLKFKRGNAQKGLLAHLAALFLLFLVFEFFSFGPPVETKKKKVVLAQI